MDSLNLSLSDDELRKKFHELKSTADLADLLDINIRTLNYFLYYRPTSVNYRIFKIPKKSGGFREVSAPVTSLKIIQRKLNQVLQAVYHPWKKPSVHGFVHGNSIISNAQAHAGAKQVLNLDLKDFFPSITANRVAGLLARKPYKIPFALARIIATLVCNEDKLPQGAPTSPVISNMICSKLDNDLQVLAKKYGCFYTRYADDITFSTKRRFLPANIVVISSGETAKDIKLGSELERIISENGFVINPEKIRVARRNEHQEVTGLTVNEFPNVQREFINQLRSILYAWQKHGYEKAEKEHLDKYRKQKRSKHIKSKLSLEEIVRGKIEFLGAVRGKNHPIYLKYFNQYKLLTTEGFQPPDPMEFSLESLPLVFLSYSNKDEVFTRKIYTSLKNYGAKLWFDKENIPAGNRWDNNVQKGLETARIMILVMSKHSNASEQVADEWDYFLNKGKRLIPVKIDTSEPSYRLNRIQHIDFTLSDYETKLQELIKELKIDK